MSTSGSPAPLRNRIRLAGARAGLLLCSLLLPLPLLARPYYPGEVTSDAKLADEQAIIDLFTRYDEKTPLAELEAAFERISEWGPSRTQLCLGRLIIDRLDYEKRYGRAIAFIEKCQAVSPGFLLPDMHRTRFFEKVCRDAGREEAARNLRLKNEFTLP